MYCVKCGNEMRDGARFCPKCGAPNPDSGQAPAQAQANARAAAQPQQGRVQAPPNGSAARPMPGATQIPAGRMQTPVASMPQGQNAGRAQGMAAAQMQPQDKPQGKGPSKKVIIGIVAAVVVVIAVAVGAFFLLGGNGASIAQDKTHSTHAVTVNVQAEGYNASTDTRIPVVCTGTDFEGNQVNETFYLEADGSGVELLAGSYDISFPASPLTASGVFYQQPMTPTHIDISSDLEYAEPFGTPVVVTFTVIAATDVTDTVIQVSYDYASKDPNDGGRAAANRTATVTVRDNAVAQAAAQAAAEAAAAQAAAVKADFQARLNDIDNELIKLMAETEVMAGVTRYYIHTVGGFHGVTNTYTPKYAALAEEIKPYVSSSVASSLSASLGSVSRTELAAASPDIRNSLGRIADTDKNDANECITRMYNVLRQRYLVLELIDNIA